MSVNCVPCLHRSMSLTHTPGKICHSSVIWENSSPNNPGFCPYHLSAGPISSVCKTDSAACKFSNQPCASPTLSPHHVHHHLLLPQITSLRSALPFHALVTLLLLPSAGHRPHVNSPHEVSIATCTACFPSEGSAGTGDSEPQLCGQVCVLSPSCNTQGASPPPALACSPTFCPLQREVKGCD